MFNEYEFKKSSYMNLIFFEKEKNHELYNPWEMFSRTSKVTSWLYKSELIDSLKLYYKYHNDINLRNLFVIENDYIKESQIKKIMKISNSNSPAYFFDIIFSFGKIHTLIPNFFYLRLFEVYSFKSELNKLTKKYKFKCISDQVFYNLISEYFLYSDWSSEELIKKIKKISFSKLYKIKNQKIRNEVIKKINNKEYNYIDKVNKLRKFEKSEEKIKIEYLLNSNQKINDKNLRTYYNLYYTKFDSIFHSYKKPIFGFLENHDAYIFSQYSLVYNSKFKKYFINLKNLSHQSPLIIDIITSIGTVSATIFAILEGYNHFKKGLLENHEKKLQIREKEIDIKQKELDLKKNTIEFNKELLEMTINKFEKNITNYYKDTISINYTIKIDNKSLDDE